MGAKRQRCAIYTRKSTSEGLDQEFNSLDAQREACAAYIKSQRHEGWTLVRPRFDDGGISGATMARPGLSRLLDEIRERRIDIVVVYKVDRLTRALSDFAKMVDIFDAHEVSFVSVTQQFNTTSSMGRLTLNVLLSFAQFEREVTAERIRDKIAASKRKGMWMGGVVPLGYDAVEKRLVPNAAEAKTVRRVFELYDQLGTVQAVKQEGDRLGLRTKSRRDKEGAPFTRGHLYKLLGNPLYMGEVRHGNVTYPGAHDPIINRDLWDRVQARLKSNTVDRKGVTGRSASMLGGIVFTETGQRLIPSHATKRERRYRYYATRKDDRSLEPDERAIRLPASELDAFILDVLVGVPRDEAALSTALSDLPDMAERAHRSVLIGAGTFADRLGATTGAARGDLLRQLVERIEIGSDTVRFFIRAAVLAEGNMPGRGDRARGAVEDPGQPLVVTAKASRPGRSHGRRIVRSCQNGAPASQDQKLIRAVAEGASWYARLRLGEFATVHELAVSIGRDRADVGRRLRLAFLAPDIVAAVLAGEQPADLTIGTLLRQQDVPLVWSEQRRLFGFSDLRAASARSN